VDGNSYVDYLLGLGPMIPGHRDPVVTEAVTRATIIRFNTGCILPEPGYLELLRSETRARCAADFRRGHHRIPVLT
jgi:glutamate-1-semialdehyde aminotransferase